MNTDSQLNTTFWLMVLMQTLGSVDPMPGTGARKMPAPKAYMTIIIAWSVLQIASDAGLEKGAAKLGWVMVLAGLVLGPFGKRLVSLFNWISSEYGPNAQKTINVPLPTRVQPGG